MIKYFNNIIFTRGLTFIFGIYSIYNLYLYIKHVDNKINNLKKQHFNKNKLELEFEIIRINSDIKSLELKIQKLENQYISLDKLLIEPDLSMVESYNNNEEKDIQLPIKIDEFTCITLEECSETDSIKSTSSSVYKPRSRSSSLSWGTIKTLFG